MSVYILYEESNPKPVANEHFIYKNRLLTPSQALDFSFEEGLTLESGDILFANSNYYLNKFNSYVRYRELTEL